MNRKLSPIKNQPNFIRLGILDYCLHRKIPNLKDLALRTTTFFRFFIERKKGTNGMLAKFLSFLSSNFSGRK